MLVNEMLSEESKAVVLLLLALESDEDIKILSDAEFLHVEAKLKENGLSFTALYDADVLSFIATELEIDFDRLKALLSRGFELSYEMANLNQQGIWLVTYLDNEYPKILKKKMRNKAPKMLFGIGNIDFLNRGGLALMASQSVNKNAVSYAEEISKRLAHENLMLITGGSKGVETLILETVLKNGGNAVAVIPDTLLQRCYKEFLSEAIAEERLTMISPYHPRSGFASNKLKNRNSTIFSLCDYALIIASDLKRGGTWSGAVTELKKRSHVPIFTYKSTPEAIGNKALESMGAITWPEFDKSKSVLPQIKAFLNSDKQSSTEGGQLELF